VENDLESPGSNWDSLYRARGDEVVSHRPIFTGDVFERVEVHGLGETKTKTVMVAQHPCALRYNGVDLHPRLAVVEVRTHRLIPAEDWSGHVSKMPLPELIPTVTSGRRNQAAFFDELYLASPEALAPEKRIACLSQTGVNLLLQRWVNHNSRVVIITARYQEVSSSAFEEADLIEEWCEDRLEAGLSVHDATVEAVKWLREDDGGGVTRQRLLEDPQSRSTVRSQMRAVLRSLRK